MRGNPSHAYHGGRGDFESDASGVANDSGGQEIWEVLAGAEPARGVGAFDAKAPPFLQRSKQKHDLSGGTSDAATVPSGDEENQNRLPTSTQAEPHGLWCGEERPVPLMPESLGGLRVPQRARLGSVSICGHSLTL